MAELDALDLTVGGVGFVEEKAGDDGGRQDVEVGSVGDVRWYVGGGSRGASTTGIDCTLEARDLGTSVMRYTTGRGDQLTPAA